MAWLSELGTGRGSVYNRRLTVLIGEIERDSATLKTWVATADVPVFQLRNPKEGSSARVDRIPLWRRV